MQHLDDVTPSEYRFAAIPNATIDDLTRRNLLAVGVLANFIRHAESYQLTVSKLRDMAGGHGKAAISTAYNACITAGYLGRVEFTYERPRGDTGRSGRRATYAYASRVPISDEQLEQIVHAYTPGRFVFVPVKTGAVDQRGRDVYEQRRVRVLAAEIYCHRGAQRIDADGLLTEHTNRRGGCGSSAAPTAAETASPEVGIPDSGATCENDVKPLVAPEVGSPESGEPASIKKTREKTKEDQGPGASLRSLPTGQTPPQAPGFTPYETASSPEQTETDESGSAGDPPPAHARLTGDSLDEAIRASWPGHDFDGCPSCIAHRRVYGGLAETLLLAPQDDHSDEHDPQREQTPPQPCSPRTGDLRAH